MKNEYEELLELKYYVKDLFDNYLNYVEESESGNLFYPIRIMSCRAMMTNDLDKLLETIGKLSGANPRPNIYHEN